MKVTDLLLMVFLSVVESHLFPDIAAIVNGPVTLPCNCFGQVVKWTIFHPNQASIGVCQHGRCEIEQPFQKRFSIVGNTSTGNFSMSIGSAVYNDVGIYKCTCDGKSVSEGKLMVYDPRVVMVSEGENVTLPCHGYTLRDAKNVQWKKDGKILLEYTYEKTKKASVGRFTVSKEGFEDGDLSLHINSVQLSDSALYLCLIHGESRDGDPRAVLLKVEKPQPEHHPGTPSDSGTAQALGVTLGLVLLVNMIIVIIYFVRRCTSQPPERPQDAPANNPGPPVQEENPMIPKPSSTQPTYD